MWKTKNYKIFHSPLLRCPTAWEVWKGRLPHGSWISSQIKVKRLNWSHVKIQYTFFRLVGHIESPAELNAKCLHLDEEFLHWREFMQIFLWSTKKLIFKFSKYFPTWTLMILFLMRDWRNTQTSLTSLNGVSLYYLRRSNSRDSLNWFDLNYYKNSGAKKVLTDLFCMYLSLMVSQVEMQFDMYKWMNSVGNSTTVVSLFTTLKSGLQESTNQKYKNTKVSKSC